MYYHGINSFLEEKVYFGEDNTVWIGTPAEDGYSGVRLSSYTNTLTMMKSCPGIWRVQNPPPTVLP